jgi:undecaprenyl-diphosphatase
MVRRLLLAIAKRLPTRAGRRLVRAVDEDFEMLVGALLIVLAVWSFLVIANLVGSGYSRAFDERIMLALRNPQDLGDPIGPHWLESAVRDITSLGSYIVLTLLSLAVIAFFLMRRQYHAGLLVFLASLGGALIMQQLKELFGRPRPDLVPHLVEVGSLSFPSGHALSAATVYLTLAALLARLVEDRPLKIYLVSVAFALVFLVGMSRVYLGVHWPSDVLAGWTAGLAWASLCWLLTSHLQRRGAVEQPDETSSEASARAEAQG